MQPTEPIPESLQLANDTFACWISPTIRLGALDYFQIPDHSLGAAHDVVGYEFYLRAISQDAASSCELLYSLAYPDRQLASPLPDCGEHGVCDSGSDRRHRRFADSHRMFGARYDVNFYLRGFVYPEYLIIIEVTLFDAPA